MKKIFLALCIGLSFCALSCSDSLYGSTADKNTKEAKLDDTDFAFIQGNCQLVINAYDARAEAGTLSSTELYKYNNSLLACSGFDLVSSVSGIFGVGNLAGDPFDIIQGFMGTDTLTKEESAKLKATYDKILKSCVPVDKLPADMQTVCGMTAASDTVRALGDVALDLSGTGSVNLDSAGMTSAISGKTTTDISGSVNSSGVSIDELNRNLGLIGAASSAIAGQSGNNDVSDQFDKFSKDLVDTNGNVTNDSLSNYLAGKFGGVVNPTP